VLQGWSTNFLPFYNSVKNKDNRTKQQMDDYKVYYNAYAVYLRGYIQANLVNNQLISIGVRGGMGLNPRGLSAREKKVKITTAPATSLKALGGGMVQFTVKIDKDAGKAGILRDSSGLAIYYRFVSPVGPPPPPSTVIGVNPDPDTEPNPDAGLPTATGFEVFVSTKARFAQQMGMDKIGQVLQVYTQWINTSNAEFNGPYSMPISVVIS
jgi:hypothetical protein